MAEFGGYWFTTALHLGIVHKILGSRMHATMVLEIMEKLFFSVLFNVHGCVEVP